MGFTSDLFTTLAGSFRPKDQPVITVIGIGIKKGQSRKIQRESSEIVLFHADLFSLCENRVLSLAEKTNLHS